MEILLPQYCAAFDGLYSFAHMRAPRGGHADGNFFGLFGLCFSTGCHLQKLFLYKVTQGNSVTISKLTELLSCYNVTDTPPCSWIFCASCFFHAATCGFRDTVHHLYSTALLVFVGNVFTPYNIDY